MDSSSKGFVDEPPFSDGLSTTEEKRNLVHAISWSAEASEIVQSWSRRELLQILYEETGKERKYTGLTKSKIIDNLLKTVSENSSVKRKTGEEPESQTLPANNCPATYKRKRQRKSDKPARIPLEALDMTNVATGDINYCQNLACRATLHQDVAFCKRCSCYICFQYDDNKDPSLWLVCSSEPPYEGDACGMSCHLECAIKHERSGILKDEHHKGMDGCFECVHCGKVNGLLSCWRKQLLTAKDTRRVDVLCYRVSLSQRLLHGTKKYQRLNDIVETAAKKLEAEVGPVARLPVKMARGIVNRLSSGPEVQKICASALETLDLMLSSGVLLQLPDLNTRDFSVISSDFVKFENVSATSLTVVLGSNDVSAEEIVGYTLWHRKADAVDYPPDPTCTLFVPDTRFLLPDLSPATEYLIKVVPITHTRRVSMCEVTFITSCAVDDVANTSAEERDQSPITISSSVSNPPSDGDESNNITTAYGEPVDLLGKVLQERPGDSISILEEEQATWKDGFVQNATIKTETGNSANSTIGQQFTDIPKQDGLSPEDHQFIKDLNTNNGSNSSGMKSMEIVPHARGFNADPLVPPVKTGIGKDKPESSMRPELSHELYNGFGKADKATEVGSSIKKKSNAREEEECTGDGSIEREYAYCVKAIRRLECEGYIEKDFRLKFLTWYSLRATPREKRIVKVFVDEFTDDPVCLAGQLIDTFSEDIINKRLPGVLGNGFCMRFFH